MSANSIHIYGRHAVRQALLHKSDSVAEVFFANNFSGSELRQLANDYSEVGSFQPDKPPRSVQAKDNHQGIVAQINTDKLTWSLGAFLSNKSDVDNRHLALLGELQDPQNVGAVIRSAAIFGLDGVLIPQRRQTQITSAVVKVSAGMAFRIPLVSIGNVNNTLEELKEARFWAYGLDETASHNLADQQFDHSTVVVIGNEGGGIRAKTREHCDKLVSIPTHLDQPLNAAASAAISFYALSTAKK